MSPIRDLRRKKRVNRREMARQTGMSYATLCALECGDYKSIHQKTLVPLSAFFNVPGDEILRCYVNWRHSLCEDQANVQHEADLYAVKSKKHPLRTRLTAN